VIQLPGGKVVAPVTPAGGRVGVRFPWIVDHDRAPTTPTAGGLDFALSLSGAGDMIRRELGT